MDAKLYSKLYDAIANHSGDNQMTVPDALAFACMVMDTVNKTETCETIDSLIDKGIMLHAMRQLDNHHRQAVVLHDNGA